jgi:DnaJ-domain-containing protein 1
VSFTRKFLDRVNSLLEKVVADETPLSGVEEQELESELEARLVLPPRQPRENRIARLAGPGIDSRHQRAKAQQERRTQARVKEKARAQSERNAQDEAFRRLKQEARRSSATADHRSVKEEKGANAGRPPRTIFKEDEIARHYRVLNLPYGAPLEDVKSAYRKLMRKYHPDLHHQSPKKQKAANELALQVSQAYSALENWLTRK